MQNNKKRSKNQKKQKNQSFAHYGQAAAHLAHSVQNFGVWGFGVFGFLDAFLVFSACLHFLGNISWKCSGLRAQAPRCRASIVSQTCFFVFFVVLLFLFGFLNAFLVFTLIPYSSSSRLVYWCDTFLAFGSRSEYAVYTMCMQWTLCTLYTLYALYTLYTLFTLHHCTHCMHCTNCTRCIQCKLDTPCTLYTLCAPYIVGKLYVPETMYTLYAHVNCILSTL